MRKLISCFCLLYCISTVTAQKFPITGIEHVYYPQSVVATSEGTEQIAIHEANFYLNLPLIFKQGKTILVNGLKYDLIQNQYFSHPIYSEFGQRQEIHRVSYSLTVLHKLNEKWTFVTRLLPIIARDIVQRTSVATFVSKKKTEHLELGAGLFYTVQTGNPLLLPIIKIKYLKNKHFLDALLPLKLKYLYALKEKGKLDIGAAFNFNGGEYNVFMADEAFKDINRMIYSKANISALINIHLTKTNHMTFYSGISLARKHEFREEDAVFLTYKLVSGLQFGVSLTHFAK